MTGIPFVTYEVDTGVAIAVGMAPTEAAALLQNHGLSSLAVDLSAPSTVKADGRWKKQSDGSWVQTPLPDPAPPTKDQLASYAIEKSTKVMASAKDYTVGDVTISSDSTPNTISDWLALNAWATVNPSATTSWVANDGKVTVLPSGSIPAFAEAVGAHRLDVFAFLASVLTSVEDGDITSYAEIDSASWSV